ncbi:MAG: hypothetical protein HY943_05970 [Gammaproteobacteria bacterium]|nr:hypothetical protein [Gammaproteobacteria bacterium]
MTPIDRPAALPFRATSAAGLRLELNANGSLRRLDHGDIMLNLFVGTEMEGGPANVYLRRRQGSAASAAVPLLGPHSPARFIFDGQGLTAHGTWQELAFELRLVLAADAPAWFWHLAVENTGREAASFDLLYAQDFALAHYGFLRTNEFYTSQYLDHTPLAHATRGCVLATRQNLAMGGRTPWACIGSLGRGIAYATDALQFHGLATRAGRPPALLFADLPGRLQHEHALAVLQDEACTLAPGARVARGFFGTFEADHPAATGEADLAIADRTLALAEAAAPPSRATAGKPAAATHFSHAAMFPALEPSPADVERFAGAPLHAVERDGATLLSGFAPGRRHVVARAKELGVMRPHAQILRTGDRLVPDEAALTTTVFMAGVFNSMLTQGHVSINRCLSGVRSYLSLFRAQGQRVFVETDGGWQLLDVPSLFELSLDGCRWLYLADGMAIEVTTRTGTATHDVAFEIAVRAGPPRRFLIVHHLALGGDDGVNPGAVIRRREGEEILLQAPPGSEIDARFPGGSFGIVLERGTVLERIGGDELLFVDGVSRDQPYLCLRTAPAVGAAFRYRGHLLTSDAGMTKDCEAFWRDMLCGLTLRAPAGSPQAAQIDHLNEILPWFVSNALVHYLAPRGLEQFTGGGWGTRDICQGPLELLLALGHYASARDLLLRVFAAQNAAGDWPQWFTFFDRERNIRAGDSHGDIIFWPLLGLARYVETTGDGSVLDDTLPYHHAEGPARAEHTSLREHLDRALGVIESRLVPGTALIAYGHGDWNDAMQPYDAAMRENLCSSWTVTLHFQTLNALARAAGLLGRDADAARYTARAAEIYADFQRLLVVEGVTAGFAYFKPGGSLDYLLHPRDRTTGLTYSALPMIHAAANDLYTPEQVRAHHDLIREHLRGCDGVRLFDRPLPYRGGLQRQFQRAESAAFFGREIGLMYTHAHLRWAEALAHLGAADEFFAALTLVNPIDHCASVPGATRRQLNCYYSSSDAAFPDRYAAAADYARALTGEVPLDGGWRVYSSGPGIATNLVLRALLGLQPASDALVIDPCLPSTLDGLEADLEFGGHRYTVVYCVGERGHGVEALDLNGTPLAFERLANPYRPGAVRVPVSDYAALLRSGVNRLLVRIG